MSTILSNYFSKNYLPIKNLEDKKIWNSNTSFIDNSLKSGYIHSVYAQLSKIEYLKIFDKFKISNIENQKFILYGNNLIFLLIIRKKLCSEKDHIEYDTWMVREPTALNDVPEIYTYTLNKEYVAYTVEPFCKRVTTSSTPFTDISIRLIASGNWVDIDSKNRVFLGISYNLLEENTIEIPTNKRYKAGCIVKNDPVSAYSNIFEDLNKRCDYFLLNRALSQSAHLYSNASDLVDIVRERYVEIIQP